MRNLYLVLLVIAAIAAIPVLGCIGKVLSDRGEHGWLLLLAVLMVALEWFLLILLFAATSKSKGDGEGKEK